MFPFASVRLPWRRVRGAALAAAFVACCLLFVMGAAPADAYAKSYTCDRIDISAVANDDASLAVVEKRTFDFDGSFTLVGFVLDPPENGDVKVKSVTVTDEGGAKTRLEQVAFEREWRSAGGPGGDQWTFDEARDTVYCFSHYTDGVYSVTVTYSYTNAVKVYADVSELYWQFVGSNMEVDSNSITALVTLPTPSGQQAVGGDNVRAWGHGTLDGNVSFDEDGTVRFAIPRVDSGDFAEMRITYPASWTSKAPKEVRQKGMGLDSIMAEEQKWADDANAERVRARVLSFGPGGLSVAALIWCIVMFLRHGREHETEFQGEYWRDVPEKGMPPAVVGRIVRWNEESTNDFTATLMSLAARGVVRMEKRTVEVPKKRGGFKTVEDYVLIQTGHGADGMNDLERRAYSLVFDKIGRGAAEVGFEDIKYYGKENPESLVNAMENWQGKVGDWVRRSDAFEKEGEKWSRVFKIVPVVFAFVGLVAYFEFGNWLVLVSVLPASVVMFFLSGKIRRRSQVAAEVNAKCVALKKWFKDFTNLKEAVPTDTKVWGELLVYAYLFGVAREVVQGLKVRVPQLWDDDWFYYYSYWYWTDYGEPYGSAFDNSLGSTVSSARAAISNDSDSGGGGGGFSGGGGGGFGGGGGGFAR